MMMILRMITTTKPYAYDNDTDDDNDHKNDSYTAAGAAPGASVPCSLFFFYFSLFEEQIKSFQYADLFALACVTSR